MINDAVTLKDLSVFPSGGSNGIIGLVDRTSTVAGKEMLYRHVRKPPATYQDLLGVQKAVQYWAKQPQHWPAIITNGTLVMLEKFFESADNIASPPSGLTAFLGETFQKMFNKGEYFFTQFSVSHISDFLKGCSELVALLEDGDLPELMRAELSAMQQELQHRLTDELIAVTKETPYRAQAKLSYYIRREMKNRIYRLVDHYAKLDAWQSMGRATVEHNWTFPELQPATPLFFEAGGLVHPLLQQPTPYDISFNRQQNFLLLTGANMSGKTTFMRAIGVATLLAHLGMGVPAARLRISFFKGIITNMHVEDDLLKGESYFFAEVKRMKHTAEKLLQPEPHLVLMDELFKGTNVHDAYECTRAVVEGLLNRPDHLKILSTHLHEVAKHFADREEILFAYFVTRMTGDENFHFDYQLKEGISQDRIGYRILQKEGVLELLKKGRAE